MLRYVRAIAGSLTVAACLVHAEGPTVNFNGFLDGDVWADMKGAYYTNTELDLGLTVNFTDKISAHVYATVNGVYSDAGTGNVPAGAGDPSERWITMKFDGYDISYASRIGTFSVGDIVYQYGKFNYYFYKRYSMITNENFSRGVKYSVGNDKIATELQVGVADIENTYGDIQGMTKVNLNENHSVCAFYGIRGTSQLEFKTGTDLFAGLEYNGVIGENAKVKFDVGYQSLKGDERANLVTLLLEPSLTLNKFSLAMTGFVMIDPDSVNDVIEAPIFSNVRDEYFVYAEPGFSFNDHLGVGLPIEYHGKAMEEANDDQFWLVPTFYVYPTANVQWWIWGQMVKYVENKIDNDYALGSEIIVTF